jgi:hypothetical protein
MARLVEGGRQAAVRQQHLNQRPGAGRVAPARPDRSHLAFDPYVEVVERC